MRGEARELADAVLDLYAGSGRWHIRRPDGADTISRCLDFGLVSAALYRELDHEVRREMADVVANDLLVGGWMRALSLKESIASACDRPDHGATGAFCAWPGVTAHGLARLGFRDRAMEIVTGTDGQPRLQVAERGVSNRETTAGAAGAEAVMSALFDVNPSFAGSLHPGSLPDTVSADGIGTLSGLGRAE